MPYQLGFNLIMHLEVRFSIYIQFEADFYSILMILREFTSLFYKIRSLKYPLVQTGEFTMAY